MKKKSTSKKNITDARADDKGNIIAVKLKGNSTFTNIDTAISMTEQGVIDAVVVNPKSGPKHLRTRPDGKQQNNLDNLAGDD